jgi:serine/threonine-protein kinase
MEEAHALGVGHLDLKPANMFVTSRPDGSACVKVLDFGVARSFGDDLATSGKAEGTPAYMAPEQVLGGMEVGVETDVWALGVTLYELLAGRPPFRAASSPRLLRLVLDAEHEPLSSLRPDLPPGLAAVVERCLQKNRARRFRSVAELRAALAPFAAAGGGAHVADRFATASAVGWGGARAGAPTVPLSGDSGGVPTALPGADEPAAPRRRREPRNRVSSTAEKAACSRVGTSMRGSRA